jgi:prepilin signal peptidase PulO-like enzyme (type II secretory pathway)
MAEVYFFLVFKVLIGLVVGGTLGSFFGVIYHRIPQGESIIHPPSYCDHCKQPLKARDLIPVVSYYLNKGECRMCHGSIGQENLVFEIVFIVITIGFIFVLYPSHLEIHAPLTDFIHQR